MGMEWTAWRFLGVGDGWRSIVPSVEACSKGGHALSLLMEMYARSGHHTKGPPDWC